MVMQNNTITTIVFNRSHDLHYIIINNIQNKHTLAFHTVFRCSTLVGDAVKCFMDDGSLGSAAHSSSTKS